MKTLLTILRLAGLFVFPALVSGLVPVLGPALAQEPMHIPDTQQDKAMLALEKQTVTVLGVEIVPMSGLYVVNKDVNVRKGPDTKFKRVAGLKEGTHVRVIGKPKGTSWLAVSLNGETLGFVFSKMLIPVVDGSLDEQFLGSYSSPDGVACGYRFRFESKNKVEGASFDAADYEVRFRCASQKGAASFYAHMFLTEGPVIERKGLHLIGLDVRSIGDGIEKFLTTRYLYDPKTGKMTFNGHSMPIFALPPKIQTFETTSVKDALKQSLEASIASWTPKAWETLFTKAE
ncbi:MAG: SH3 domain-containing protein [Magnetovibrio sp.]|nr:SH3 domain-containing protein [Magnetovibrio sp.]